MTMLFTEFSFIPEIIRSIKDAGYKNPSPIQEQAIPEILNGNDIRGSARTGSGKTAAFLLPALHRLATTSPLSGKGPRLLILSPTRELGSQIAAQVEKYSKYLPKIKSVCIGGGVPYHKQLSKMKKPYDILIATPGRLLDFMKQGIISFPRLEVFIVDEADRMLDMGFIDPLKRVLAATPEDKQTLFFSATFGRKVSELSNLMLQNPVDIAIESDAPKHENIEQKLYYTNGLPHKKSLLTHFLSTEEIDNIIVFTSTKVHANELVIELREEGHNAAALHGDMHQRKRTDTIKKMRRGKIKILVATDVAARGIDIQSITHVINFDLPRCPEDYVHRIGRTGRAGAKGTAISFVSGKDTHLVKKIEGVIKHPLEFFVIEGLEPKKEKKPSKKFHKKRPFPFKKRRFKKKT